MGADLTCVTQQFFSVCVVSEGDFTHHCFLNCVFISKLVLGLCFSLAGTLMEMLIFFFFFLGRISGLDGKILQ